MNETWSTPEGVALYAQMGFQSWCIRKSRREQRLAWHKAVKSWQIEEDSGLDWHRVGWLEDEVADMILNNRAREVGEKVSMYVRPSMRGGYAIARTKYGETWDGHGWAMQADFLGLQYPTYTAACMAMVRLALTQKA